MKKVNIGVIGCGHWGPNFIRNFNRIKGVSVKYACDLNIESLSRIRKLYPETITTQDYRQILKDNNIDAVIIATPANTHYRLTKESLAFDKHVLVEKPIALRINEVKELIKIAKENKRVLMVGHTFKFNPGISKLKWFIKTSKLGRIYYIYSRRTNLGPLRQDVSAMWDLASHDISILNYLLNNKPISVIARGEKYISHNLEDICFITLTFPGKILAHIHVSWLDPKKVREIVVVGSKKMAVFDDLDLNAPVKVYDKSVVMKKFKQDYSSFEEFQMIIRDGSVILPKIKKVEPLFAECRHFIGCVRENKNPFTDGRDGLEVLKVLIGIQDSLAKNSVSVSLKNK
jgi:predicted dehydrogenase